MTAEDKSWILTSIIAVAGAIMLCVMLLSGCVAPGQGRPFDFAKALSRAACHVEPILETVETWSSDGAPQVSTSTTTVKGFRILLEER